MVFAIFETAAQFAGGFGKQCHFPWSGTAQSHAGTDSVQGYCETR